MSNYILTYSHHVIEYHNIWAIIFFLLVLLLWHLDLFPWSALLARRLWLWLETTRPPMFAEVHTGIFKCWNWQRTGCQLMSVSMRKWFGCFLRGKSQRMAKWELSEETLQRLGVYSDETVLGGRRIGWTLSVCLGANVISAEDWERPPCPFWLPLEPAAKQRTKQKALNRLGVEVMPAAERHQWQSFWCLLDQRFSACLAPWNTLTQQNILYQSCTENWLIIHSWQLHGKPFWLGQ